MSRLRRAALVVQFLDGFEKHESWSGETHLQKAVYLWQALVPGQPIYNFVLYKHGPFSFDLRRDLGDFRADGLIEVVRRPIPYGPSLKATRLAHRVFNRSEGLSEPSTVAEVCELVASRGAAQLERLATALYVEQQFQLGEAEKIATRLTELKPHVSFEAAVGAAKEILEFQAQLSGVNAVSA